MRGGMIKRISLRLFLYPALAFLAVLTLGTISHAACTVSTTAVSFGNYDVFLATPTDAIGRINIRCNNKKKTKVRVAIGPSPNSGLFTPRQMKNTMLADLLNYDLYTKKKMTKIWGDGTGGTSIVKKKVKKNKTKKLKVYGRIPPLQDVSAGSYTDTLTVTITF